MFRSLPARTLSRRRPRDYLLVLYWALWSPRMFARYGEYLLDKRMEARPPRKFDPVLLDRWREDNWGHRDFLSIAFWVWVILFGGLAVMNTVCVVP